ncbi:MAG: hypothetical protein RIS47_415 [Bacteroidota bacterium]
MKRFVSIIVALLCLHGAIAQDVRMSEMLHGSVCFSPDGKNILTSSGQLIDLKTGKVALNLNYNGTDQNGDPTFFEAAFSPKGKYILYNRQIFDGQTAKNIITLPPKESAARNYPDSEKHFFQLKNLETASFSADESKVLAGDQLFDVKSGKLLTTLKPKAYKSGPAFITFSGNTYRSIINTVSISTELGDFSSNYNDAVSPNLKYYLSAESLKDESISFFDIVQKSARENYDEKEDLLSLWYEMDGKKTGSDRLSNRFEEDKAHFSLDGQRVVIIDGKSAKIFNMKNGKLISKIDGSDDWENGYLSPSGKLVFLYEYLQMEIYEVDTKKKLCVLYGDGAVDTESREPSFSVSNPIFSPNDKYFINGADGQIWDVKTGAKLGKLPLYNFKMDAISAQIGDNQRIAIQYRDGSSRLFDTVSGEELFTNITQNVNTMLFTVSRDCKWAAATDWNGNLSVWDISSPTPIKSWEAHGGALLTQIVFDTAENTLITYGIDQKIKTWNLPLLTETNIITAEKPFSQIFLEGTDLLGVEGFTVNLIDKKNGKKHQ